MKFTEGKVVKKRREQEEEKVSRYCINLRNRESTGIWEKTREILLRGELDLEESMDLSLKQTT